MTGPELGIDAAWAALSTAEVSDALDRLGVDGQLPDVGSLTGSTHTCGRAFTVAYGSAARPPGTVGDFLDEVPPGQVVVIDNRGRTDCTVWGGILTRLATERGVAGTVINGVARDTVSAEELGYPLFARGRYMRTGKDRVQVDAVQTSVTICGVRVSPGDVVLGDRDGVVVVPRTHESEVLRVALEINEIEHRISELLTAGSTLADARATTRYHRLQRRSEQ
ncbi:RraA family protein [Mycobacterium sp. BMJ-28]